MSSYKQLLILAEHYFNDNNFIYSEALLKKVIELSPNNSKANELLGYIYANQGNFDLAFKFLELACQKDVCSPEALYYFGSFQLKRNLFNQAIDTLKKAINKKGIFFEALHDLGACYGHIGKVQEALSCYERCLKLKKDSFELYFNIGRCLDELKRYEEALVHYDKAIKLKPDYEIAWLNKGITLNDLGRYDEAIVHYNQVLQLNPQSIEAWSYKGAILDNLGRYDESLFQYDEAIRLKPEYAEAWSNKGATLNDLMRYEEALFHYDEAIRLKPEYAEAWSNKGATLNDLMRYEEALFHYDEAIRLKPEYAEAWSSKGATLNNLKRYDEALFHYDKAIRLKPDYDQAYFNRAILKLNLKIFDRGWEDYEVRVKNKNIINFKFPFNIESIPVWDGVIPCKNLLVIHEQGIGDQIFYASTLLQIQSIVEKITVLIDGRLIPIFSRSFPSIKFLDKKNSIDTDAFNAQIAIGSLPRILKDSFFKSDILKQAYLVDNFGLTNKIKNSEIFKNKFTCGISWKSSNKKLGIQKSINLIALSEILKVPNCEFINLQYGDTTQEVGDFEEMTEVKLNNINDIDIFSDIEGLLSIIQSCDIVITTSNVTAHLAGAIGKKTLLLLPYSQGRIWYWHEEPVSTWYPSVKQYFQDFDHGWEKAIKEIAAELRCEIDRKN